MEEALVGQETPEIGPLRPDERPPPLSRPPPRPRPPPSGSFYCAVHNHLRTTVISDVQSKQDTQGFRFKVPS